MEFAKASRVHAIDEMASYITWCMTTLSGTPLDEVVDKKYDLESAYKHCRCVFLPGS